MTDDCYIEMPTKESDSFQDNLNKAEAIADLKKMKVKFYSWERGRNITVEET